MAKEVKITTEETLTNLEKVELWFKENQKTVTGVSCAIVAAIVLCLSYYFFLYVPKQREAQAKLASAVALFNQGDYQNALYGADGLENILQKYGSKTGTVAYFYAAAAALKAEPADPQAALEYIAKFKSSDKLFAARAEALKGDAYSFEGEYEKAAACYEKAAQTAGDINSVEYTFKAGNTYELLGQNDKALAAYKAIKEQFPTDVMPDAATYNYIREAQMSEIIMTIDKYISRLEVK